jgi:hypothetical protein
MIYRRSALTGGDLFGERAAFERSETVIAPADRPHPIIALDDVR